MDIKTLTDEVEHISRGYASRFEITRDESWFLLKLQEEVGELTQAHLMRTGQARTKGRTADGIDAEAEIGRKWLVWRDASPRPEDVLPHDR